METISFNRNNNLIRTNKSYDKYLQQSPKFRNNKYRPISGKPKNINFFDNKIYDNKYIAKGTNFPQQLKRLSNEELITIIGPMNKRAGNNKKNKKKILKNFLGYKNIKLKTDLTIENKKENINNNNNTEQKNKIRKLKLDIDNTRRIRTGLIKNRNNFVKSRKETDKFIPKGYLQYEKDLLNNYNKQKIYNIKDIKIKSNESDIFFFGPRTEKESKKTIDKEKARYYNTKLGSDIFNSKKELNNLIKSGELYLFKKKGNPFSTESNSFWSSTISTQTYMNYPSVEYNILNPDIKSNTKTKETIYKESRDKNLMNPIYKQKSLSTFNDITKVGMNKNLTYQKLYEENNKIFYKNNNLCTSHYDNYKNYQSFLPKPFLTQINKNIYT